MGKIDWNIIYKKITGELTPLEEREFNDWKSSTPGSNFIVEKAKNYINKIESRDITCIDEQKKYEEILFKYKKVRKKSVINKTFYYAAASILLFISTFIIIIYNDNNLVKNQFAQASKREIVPGSKKATLVLGDGKVIELDSFKNKAFHSEKMNINIQREGKTIRYDKLGNNKSELADKRVGYNEIRIPTGGEWELTLSDGTTVKLNSKSSLRYPINFEGDTREVSLEGEGYFKVTKSDKPFIVNTNKMNIKVYGTQFNVMAYKDEDIIQTTLVEGKVGITSKSNGKPQEYILKPNEIASYNIVNNDIKINTVDVNNYISWIDGMFIFEDIDLATIMRKLSRWYDFEIFYMNDEVKEYRFSANMVRYASFDKVLKVIKETSYVDFLVKGKTVTVIKAK